MSSTVRLRELAFARSGDKNDTSNIGVIPYDENHFELLKDQVTVARIGALFSPVVRGPIRRYELPGIRALNFVMEGALGGGVSRSLALDAHGKSFGLLVLTLEIEVPEDEGLQR